MPLGPVYMGYRAALTAAISPGEQFIPMGQEWCVFPGSGNRAGLATATVQLSTADLAQVDTTIVLQADVVVDLTRRLTVTLGVL